MKKIILIPDSFKGTLSSQEVCEAMKQAVVKICPQAQVVTLPVADGGEGTVAAFLAAMSGSKINCRVQGPLGEPLDSFYGILSDGSAVIEMAAAAGLPLVSDRLSVGTATTYGVGELMQHALTAGTKKIILGLGGSATNDGGCGAAVALGCVFYNYQGEKFVPTGDTLSDIASIDIRKLQNNIAGVEVVVMCDITNPLCGPLGAAAIFAPQKGASLEQVESLDAGLAHLAQKLVEVGYSPVDKLPGAGAAGGMGAGAAAFFQGRLMRGIDVVLDAVNFTQLLAGADVVFTGEGKFDNQSLMGKVVAGVAARAKVAGVPVFCLAGAVDEVSEQAYENGVTAVFSINRKPVPFSEAVTCSRENLVLVMENILRLLV